MAAGENSSAVIGRSVDIRGEVKGSEDLLIEGHVEGTITLTAGRLTIGAHAHVTANVAASEAIVLGQLNGNIRASGRVELRKGCDLSGDIVSSRLSIEEGAVYRGKVDLVQSTAAALPGAAVSGAPSGKAGAPELPLVNATAK